MVASTMVGGPSIAISNSGSKIGCTLVPDKGLWWLPLLQKWKEEKGYTYKELAKYNGFSIQMAVNYTKQYVICPTQLHLL